MSSATEHVSKPDEDEHAVTPDDGIVREIGHDEYDPIGTLVLVALYFVILGVLWIFMYFVEFLGRPTPMVV